MTKVKHTGFAIALAWPETYCKQAGSWYDSITSFLKISTNNYYKAGHAALILISDKSNECKYFDFGRYHTPFQHGRVRSAETDIELTIHTKAQIENNTIINFDTILTELQNNESCHGDGALHASYNRVNFEYALAKAIELQDNSPILYGPFLPNGTNCSRFVNSCLIAGRPSRPVTFALKFAVPLTPTPLNNVHAMGKKIVLKPTRNYAPFCPTEKRSLLFLQSTLPEPERPANISKDAQWLSGEGAGSWFQVSVNGSIHVKRYAPNGKIEFEKHVKTNYILHKNFKVTYPSHYKQIRIINNNKAIILA